MAGRPKLTRALIRAYDSGAIDIDSLCPTCWRHMGSFHHGQCDKCGKYCGCSFNPTLSGDFCDMHGARGEFKRRLAPGRGE